MVVLHLGAADPSQILMINAKKLYFNLFFFSIGEVFGTGVGRDMLFMPYVLVM